jgi:hypothetical protein
MSKKIVIALMLSAVSFSAAQAHETSQPSLLGGLISLGGNPLASVKANVGTAVKADVKVGAAQSGYGAPSSSLANLNVEVPGLAKANVAVGSQSRNATTLLGVSATVLDGGVGRRDW